MTPWAVLFSIALLLALLVSGRVKPAIAFVTLAGIFLLLGLVDTSPCSLNTPTRRLPLCCSYCWYRWPLNARPCWTGYRAIY